MLITHILLTCLLSLRVHSFVHPGLLATDADLSRATGKITAAQSPWNGSYAQLTECACASADYVPSAVSAIYRGSDGVHVENTALLWNDAAAAFALALRWKLTGNDSYADAAANILTAWGETLETIGGNDDAYLCAGFQGHELANAGELLRDYAPFAADGLHTFQNMMTSVFLPMNLDFLDHVLGSEHNVKHFFANWELGNLASAMAIAVLTDNTTLWDFSIDYFKNGEGNGCINNAVTNLVIEPGTGVLLGQGQESGRDQGHSALDWQMLGVIGQQAWNQGEDLFGYNDSRILRGAEYFARYNLGYDVDFEPYTNNIVSYTTISDSSRGANRPAWELLYSHYVQVKGLDAPWTTAYLNYSLSHYGGFEPGAGTSGSTSGAFDSLGWGSLLYHRDANDTSSVPPSVPSSISSSVGYSTQLHTSSSLPYSSISRVSSASTISTGVVAPESYKTSAGTARESSYATASSRPSTTASLPSQAAGSSSLGPYSVNSTNHAHTHGCHARRHYHG